MRETSKIDCLRYGLKKKLRDYLGIFPKCRTPHTHTHTHSLLGTLCSKIIEGDFVKTLVMSYELCDELLLVAVMRVSFVTL